MAMKEHVAGLFRKGKLSRQKGAKARAAMDGIKPKKKKFNKGDGY